MLLPLVPVVAFLRFANLYLDDVTRGHAHTLGMRTFEEATGLVAGFAFVALIVLMARRFPPDRSHWRTSLLAHLAGAIAISAVHTTIMAVLRWTIAPLVGLGAYDYGRLGWRYLMELPNDVILYTLTLSLLMLLRYRRAIRERERRQLEMERALAEAQLRTLRLQLQPHFLFNALNTVSSVMYDDPAAADELLGRLGDLLRRSLAAAPAHEVPLRDELALLDDYVAILRGRFGGDVAIRVVVAPGLEGAAVPSLLLQPLVENAVRHGNAARIGRGVVDVRVHSEGNRLRIEVEDDGPGAPPGRDVLASGLGLGATAERLRLLHGDAHTLEAGNLPGGGFRVRLELPLRAAPPAPPPAPSAFAEPPVHAGPGR
ncbi:MAG TPA: histidine kinase [Longimicrobiales bacterium]|nr:histidine kinase [Longimicrobiales bacterium]